VLSTPIIPIEVNEEIQELISHCCPLSRVEILEDGDEDNKIYKFVGMVTLEELYDYLPSGYRFHDDTDFAALLQYEESYTCVYWQDGIVNVMISSTEDQHYGVMDAYEDVMSLLTKIGSTLAVDIRLERKAHWKKVEEDSRKKLLEVVEKEKKRTENCRKVE
jgi:hypothetical protein